MKGDRFRIVTSNGRRVIVDSAPLRDSEGRLSCFNIVAVLEPHPGGVYAGKPEKAVFADIVEHLNEQARRRMKPRWLPEKEKK